MAPFIRSDPCHFMTSGIRGAPAPFAQATAGVTTFDAMAKINKSSDRMLVSQDRMLASQDRMSRQLDAIQTSLDALMTMFNKGFGDMRSLLGCPPENFTGDDQIESETKVVIDSAPLLESATLVPINSELKNQPVQMEFQDLETNLQLQIRTVEPKKSVVSTTNDLITVDSIVILGSEIFLIGRDAVNGTEASFIFVGGSVTIYKLIGEQIEVLKILIPTYFRIVFDPGGKLL